jgi:hypothetical protein
VLPEAGTLLVVGSFMLVCYWRSFQYLRDLSCTIAMFDPHLVLCDWDFGRWSGSGDQKKAFRCGPCAVLFLEAAVNRGYLVVIDRVCLGSGRGFFVRVAPFVAVPWET